MKPVSCHNCLAKNSFAEKKVFWETRIYECSYCRTEISVYRDGRAEFKDELNAYFALFIVFLVFVATLFIFVKEVLL